MKAFKSPVGAQGATAEQFAIAQISDQFTRIFGLVVLIANLGCLASSIFAQSYDTLDVSLYNFQITAPTGNLNQGESATFYIHIGTESEPVSNAVGFDIELTLGTDASFPTDPDFDLSNSWLLPSGADTTEFRDADEGTVRLLADRNDSETATGHGELFAFTVQSNANGVPAASLVTGGGGLIMVDNVGYKTAPQAESVFSSNPVLYPNPCQARLKFDWKGGKPLKMHLVSMTGQLIEVPVSDMDAGVMEVSNLPSGMYQAVLQYPEGQQVRKVMINH